MKFSRISPKLSRLFLGSLLVAGFSFPVFGEPVVEGVRMWRAPDNTRLVFDLSDSTDHSIFELSNPSRLVIDLEPASFDADLSTLEFDQTPVRRIRTGTRDGGGLRVVVDLKNEIKPRSFSLEPSDNVGHRLVVDLFDQEQVVQTSISDVIDEDRQIVIAIDAGHGGKDPGALGPGEFHEKHIAFAVSKLLAEMVDAHPGYKAELIRDGDYYVPLRERTALAREKRADFFLSIHADAFRLSSVHGASIYALSAKGATSERARIIAERENQSDLIGGAGDLSLKDKEAGLVDVLLDLSLNATIDTSLNAGEHILAEMGAITKLHKKQVEQAGFVVLKSPDIPSLLIETGFITNPEEARRLLTKTYQEKMARAIFNGVRSYFASNPPAGTLIAAQGDTGPEVYLIKSGDTLSEIADRYNVSLNSLKAVNDLSGSVIRIGQELQIPNS